MERARTGLHKIMFDAIRRAPAADAPLIAWQVACGPGVAARTRALDFTSGILRVEVPDAAWRTQLLELVPQYLSTLRQVADVKRIEFVLAKCSVGTRHEPSREAADGR
jgi:hypothetical protein